MHTNVSSNERCCWPHKRISWTGIVAGVISALVLEALLNLLGAGIGLVSYTPDVEEIKGLGIGSVIWLIIASIISLFVGGWIASFSSGRIKRKSGILQGFLTWGLASLITLFFMATTTGAIISGASGLIGQGLNTIGKVAVNQKDLAKNTGISAINSKLKPGVDKDEFLDELKDPVITYASTEKVDEKNEARQNIINIVSTNTTLSAQEIEQKINDVEKSYNDMKQKAADASDKAGNIIGGIAIATFISFLLSAIAAIIGGAIGVIGNRHHIEKHRNDIIS